MKKYYILDTNILIQTNGSAIRGFEDNYVVITHTSLEELDNLKSRGNTGYSARESLRIIDEIIHSSKRINSSEEIRVLMDNGGTLILEPDGVNIENLPFGWELDKPDNRIISAAISIRKEKRNRKVILVTNDRSMRIKAEVAGLDVQDYKNERVNIDKLYTGRAIAEASNEVINRIYKEKYIDISDVAINERLQQNEYVEIRDFPDVVGTRRTVLGVVKEDKIILIDRCRKMGIKAKNSGQEFAINALFDESIPLVLLLGPAGCGKTYLSMVTALNMIKFHKYEHLYITRSNSIPENEDLGFLPGSLEEKMSPLLYSFQDNLEEISGNKDELKKMQDDGTIELCPMAYIRGRTIRNSLVIIDEAQNISPAQAKTLITRIAEGSKLVMLGDPRQIDSNKMDALSNGLVYTASKFIGNKLCAQLTFENSEAVRSELSKVAAELL